MPEDYKEISLECPNCDFDILADITTTINADDQALTDLFNGELNNVICNQCAQSFLYETPLIFKSSGEDFIIYFNPVPNPSEWQKAEEQMQRALSFSLQGLESGDRPECRLTLTRNDFIEKIALYIAGLDDKIIEYLKFHIYTQEGAYDPARHILLYDFSRSDSETLEFSVVDSDKGKVIQNTQTPMKAMEQMKNLLEAEDCPIDLDDIFAGSYVQVKKILNK